MTVGSDTNHQSNPDIFESKRRNTDNYARTTGEPRTLGNMVILYFMGITNRKKRVIGMIS